MLKKQLRLAKTQDVQKVFAHGRAFFNPFFTVRFKPSNLEASRFTVVVSTKVSKKAVQRNRIKRVLREFLRLNISKFKLGDYAVIVKPKAAKESNLPLILKELLIKGRLFL